MNDAFHDDRLLDLARRLLDGEAIDWDREGIEEAEVREGMKRLERIVGRPARTTETRDVPAPELPPPPPPPPPPREREDRFIGDFRLVRKLGEGGMGVVYEAEQQNPRRPVALKVIRGGAHVSPETLKLFQREAQTLARLRHPGIAALYETGATEDGLHFFAMELVRGSTLTAWLGQRPAGPLAPHEVKLRLSIFKKVCDAVAYAHQKGVIHRDLKPANVLIPKAQAGSSLQDEVPDVKVLDFGLARITDSDVQATTYITEMGKIRGTLPYMSPEQVRGNPDEIDLRTDVYALGVMLYEMMTGTLPYDLSKAQIPEAARIICEQAPKSISASFSGTKHLDADIVTIAGKCLEKEASRRYQSAAALGEDVQRYLSDQPILARPPSAAYQFRKLAARHKGAVAFAATVFVLLTALAVTMTIQAFRISKERDRANQEAETAKQVSAFLEGLFKVSDPSEARGNAVTAREILDKGAEKIETELKDQPRTRARLLTSLGETYLSLGLVERATVLRRKALQINAETYGTDTVEYAVALAAIAETTAQAREAFSIVEMKLPPDDARRLKATWILGNLLYSSGSLDEARQVFLKGLAQIEASRSPNDQLRIWFLNDLGVIEAIRGRFAETRRWFEQAQEYRERIYPANHPERSLGLSNLGDVLMRQGDYERARTLIERALSDLELVYGRDHINVTTALSTLAELDFHDARLGDARAALERVCSILDRHGQGRSTAAIQMRVLRARVDEAEGNLTAAETGLRKALDVVAGTLGYDNPAQLDAIELLAGLLRRTGRTAEAGKLDARTAEIRSKSGLSAAPPTGVSVPFTRIEQKEKR